MSNKEIKEKIDQMLFDLEINLKIDKKNKIRYDELFDKLMDIRVKIQQL